MTITRCYKFRLEPTAEQKHEFLRFAGCRRFIWNWALERKQAVYKDKTRMKSPFLFLSLTLLAELTAYNIASSSGMPNFNVARTSTVCTMLVLAGQSNKGNKYSAPDGSFTVKFPGKPSEQNQTVQTEIGPIKVLSVYCHAHRGRRTFAVSRSQSKCDPGDNVEDGIAGTINGMVKSQNATVSHEIKINYKGVPGRQLYLTTKQGKEKSRIFAV